MPSTPATPDEQPDGVSAASADGSGGDGVPPKLQVAVGMPNEPGGANDQLPPSGRRGTVNAGDAETYIEPRVPDVVISDATHGESSESSTLDPTIVPLHQSELQGEGPESTFFVPPEKRKQNRNPIPQDIGPYEILGELGRGGMGVVYKARHRKLHRDVAIKMILRAVDEGDELRTRFQLEAQSVAGLVHPGIVQLYEFGEQQGLPWFALELIDGQNLAQITAREPLEPRRAAKIVADLAAAVTFAHDRGVLHRDIKPANVLIGAGDVPKLTDFGLAKRVTADDDASDHKTIDGQIMGTPSYMPPEQARGLTDFIGPQSDQYSLGATLYHLLAGRAPYVGPRSMDVLLQVIEREPLAVRQLQPNTPLDLETICMKAMARDAAKRYPDCAAFEADLRRFLRNEPIVARPIGKLERTIRWCRRNPRIAIPAATAIVSMLMALIISIWSANALSLKNMAISRQRDIAIGETKRANKNADEAKDNADLARQRAIDAKDSIVQMLVTIRNDIPKSTEELRPVRERLLRIASSQLDRLPDESDDKELTTGLEKARVLEERYLTALELGEPSKAVEYLDEAEKLLQSRNTAQATDVTRLNLTTVMYRQAQARMSVGRDMEKVRSYGERCLKILDEIIALPSPLPFNSEQGSVPPIDTLTQIMIQGYQHSLTLKKLGRVNEALEVLERAMTRFDEAMAILRAGPFKEMPQEQWTNQKQTFRGMLADQDQLRATLLASVGRDAEAAAEQATILENVRKFVAEDQSPGKIESNAKLALALVFSGDMQRQRGQINEALASYEEAAIVTNELYHDNPALEDRRNRRFISLMRLAGMRRSRDLPRARELYAEARKIAEDMVQSDANSITAGIALALVSPFSGPPTEAAALAEDILKRIAPGATIDAELRIDTARVFAAAAEAATISNPPDLESSNHWKARALSLIGDAFAEGYCDRVYLVGEPDFASIRKLNEFEKLTKR